MPIYLDNAATSFPKPEPVYQAVDDCLRRHGAAFGRSSHAASEDVRDIVGDCRRQVARFLDAASPSQVVFTCNCTDSLNAVIHGLPHEGDRVVTTTLEHNSVLRPLQQLAEQRGILVETVGFDPGTGRLDLDDMQERITSGPLRLVAVTHASNVTGCVQPIEEIVRMAHDAGALVLLDAAQTVGHLPVSMQKLDVDFLAAAGHKGLLGPLGTGILVVRSGLETQLRPYRSGGTGTASESLHQPEDMPHRFESGNLNVPGIAGLRAGVAWLTLQGLPAIQEHAVALTRKLCEGLCTIDRVRCFPHDNRDDADAATGIVSFTVEGMDCRDVGMILDQSFGIQCRTGLHCAPLAHHALKTQESGGTVRFSVGPFNTEPDIDAAIAAVAQISSSVAP